MVSFSVVDHGAARMAESNTQCWLVERELSDRDFLTLVYATPDGSQYVKRELAGTLVTRGTPITAGRSVDATDLEPVSDPETVARYADEATRVRETHDPDDPI